MSSLNLLSAFGKKEGMKIMVSSLVFVFLAIALSSELALSANITSRHHGLYSVIHCDAIKADKSTTVSFQVILRKKNHTHDELLAAGNGCVDVVDRLAAMHALVAPTNTQFEAVAAVLGKRLLSRCKKVWDGYICDHVPVAEVMDLLSGSTNGRMCLFSRLADVEEGAATTVWLANMDDVDVAHHLSISEHVSVLVGLGLHDYTKHKLHRPKLKQSKPLEIRKKEKDNLRGAAALAVDSTGHWNNVGLSLVNWPNSGLKAPFIVNIQTSDYNSAIESIHFVPICKNGSTAQRKIYNCPGDIYMNNFELTVFCYTTRSTLATVSFSLFDGLVRCSTFADYKEEAGSIGDDVVCKYYLDRPLSLEAGYIYDMKIEATYTDSTRSGYMWLQNYYNGSFYNLSSKLLLPGSSGKVRLIGGSSVNPAAVKALYGIPPSLRVTSATYNKVVHGIITISNVNRPDPDGGFATKDLTLYLAYLELSSYFNVSKDFFFVGSEVPPHKGETTLDVEMMAGICPGARIVLYNIILDGVHPPEHFILKWARNLTSVADRTNASAMDQTPPTVWSSSYAIPLSNPEAYDEVDLYLRLLSAAGVTVLAASGDDGAKTTWYRGHPPPFPW